MSRELENPVINIFEDHINRIKKIEKNARLSFCLVFLTVFFNINKIKNCVEKYPFYNMLRGEKKQTGENMSI
jgi:hypothetical protein